MVSHFNLTDSYSSLYFAISSIQSDSSGYVLCGIVGDGSAEAAFEALVGDALRVTVLPIWDAGCDALCQRYEQEQLEVSLAEALRDIQFRSELRYDTQSGCWQKQVSAVPVCDLSPSGYKQEPHLFQQAHEPAPTWNLAAC